MASNWNSYLITKWLRGTLLLVCLLFGRYLFAQTDSLAIEKLRTESGVDPTRVTSRVGYSALYLDKANNAAQVSNKVSVVLGVNRWSFSVKPEVLSQHNGVSGSGFETSFSDVKFSILNAFYVKGNHALAGSVEFSLPFGKQGFGSQILSGTPALTYSYTVTPSIFLAVQPQYTFAIAKDNLYPDLSILTTRVFIAKFTTTGLFYVFEPRTIFDFENDNFDFILSPIVGKSLGAGFNLIGLMEIPTKKATFDTRGILYQVGFNKNF